MEGLGTEVKQVARRLLHSPMFTLVAIATIGIGVGANTAIFSVIDGVLLKPLPYPEADRLVSVWQTAPGLNIKDLDASPADYFTYRDENRTFQAFGIWRRDRMSVTGFAEPEQVLGVSATQGVLDALGIQPMLGRWFTAADDTPGNPDTVILTYAYWERRFGGDRSVAGRQIRIDGKNREIAGVMPQRFQVLETKADVLLPMQFDRAKTHLGNYSFQAVARLKPGVTIAQANADVGRMIPLVNERFPAPAGFSGEVFRSARIAPALRPLKDDVVGDLGKVLWVLMATIGMVLLIACANIANLLLVRAEGRQQELAIRAALGAGWGRLARSFSRKA